MKVSRLLKLLLLFQCSLLTASCPVLAEEIFLDKRNTSSNTAYTVKFCVRNSAGNKTFPGHCYMVWSKITSSTPVQNEAYGFYPNPQAPLYFKFASFPGLVKAENPSQTNPTDCTITVFVSSDAYDKSLETRNSFSGANYAMGINDCVSACNMVARTLGIKNLQGTAATKPNTFIHELYELNKSDSLAGPP